MNREQYLEMRINNQFSMELFYKYYLNINSELKKFGFNQFAEIFNMSFTFNPQAILSKLDKEFNIVILENKDGQALKYW